MDHTRALKLLEADRELSPEEQRYLTTYANRTWNNLPFAVGVATERRRLREAWLALEAATGEDYLQKLETFRAALGVR